MDNPPLAGLDLGLDGQTRLDAVAQRRTVGVARRARHGNLGSIDQPRLDGSAILIAHAARRSIALVDRIAADVFDRAFDQAVFGEVERFELDCHALPDLHEPDVLVLDERLDRNTTVAACRILCGLRAWHYHHQRLCGLHDAANRRYGQLLHHAIDRSAQFLVLATTLSLAKLFAGETGAVVGLREIGNGRFAEVRAQAP